jgi:hypothetical protein
VHRLRRVTASASEEFRQLQMALQLVDREARRVELNRDIETANHCLVAVRDLDPPDEHAMSPGGSFNKELSPNAYQHMVASGHVPTSTALPFIPASSQFFVGSFVSTLFGIGQV